MEREKLSVHLSPLWNFSCTSGVHKNVESTNQLRRIGIRLAIYLDNILIMNQSKVNCLSDAQKTMTLLQSLGFGINMDKSVLDPTQEIVFLGYTINSLTMYLFLPKKKIINMQKLCTDFSDSTSVTVRKLSELIGTLTASIQAVFPAPLHYWFLQMAKINDFIRQQITMPFCL